MCNRIPWLALFLLTALAHGEEAPAMQGEFTLTAGPYEIQISATYAYTMRKIVFEGEALGKSTGFYGTIFAPAPGKFIGAGHKEGGLEQVQSVSLEVNGKKLVPEPEKRYAGKSLVFRKTSLLDHLRVDMKLQLTAEEIVIQKSYEAIEDQDAYSLYLYQFCWSADTKEWIAELPSGEMKEGTFLDDKGWRLQEDVKWTALYDPAIQKGMLMYYPKVIPGKMHKSGYWDQPPPRYHKYYLMMDVPAVIPGGQKSGPHVIVLKGISAGPGEWKERAGEIASKLKKKGPPNDE